MIPWCSADSSGGASGWEDPRGWIEGAVDYGQGTVGWGWDTVALVTVIYYKVTAKVQLFLDTVGYGSIGYG